MLNDRIILILFQKKTFVFCLILCIFSLVLPYVYQILSLKYLLYHLIFVQKVLHFQDRRPLNTFCCWLSKIFGTYCASFQLLIFSRCSFAYQKACISIETIKKSLSIHKVRKCVYTHRNTVYRRLLLLSPVKEAVSLCYILLYLRRFSKPSFNGNIINYNIYEKTERIYALKHLQCKLKSYIKIYIKTFINHVFP